MEFKSLEELASHYGAKEDEYVVFGFNRCVELMYDGITVCFIHDITEISFENSSFGFSLFMYDKYGYRAMYCVDEHYSVKIS